MTSRSERRDRELAVIDRAVRFRVEFDKAQTGIGSMVVARAQLFMAIDEYVKHGGSGKVKKNDDGKK